MAFSKRVDPFCFGNDAPQKCRESCDLTIRAKAHPMCPAPERSLRPPVFLRIDSRQSLLAWMDSPTRKQLIEKVRPHLAVDDDFFIRSGLDFWFTPKRAKAAIPIRWKQFLVTWSAIFPLVIVVPKLIFPLLRRLGFPQNLYTDSLWMTAAIVSLMVYVVMPRYTRLLQKWLFR